MSWAEAMKEQANIASWDRGHTDANVLRTTPQASWDPHEVWLTRVKQPREQAAGRITADAGNQVRGLRA